MKSFKQVLLAIFTGLLLSVGLAQAAESFDAVSASSQVALGDTLPSGNCIIIPR